jgi:MoaA/NifB/PqqE/SkfB family radical SAM enzyme
MPIDGYSKHDNRTLQTVAHNNRVMSKVEGDLRYEFAFIDLAAKCQYECEGCFNQNINALGVSLSRDELRGIVDFLYEREGRVITFAGSGEPLLDPEMLPLIEYAKAKGIDSVLFSSLTYQDESGIILPIDESLAQRLYELGTWVVAKRNTLDNQRQAEILGRPESNAGEMMHKGLDRVIEAGFASDGRLLMDCPIDRYTLEEVTNLLRFCRERDILPYFESYIVHGQEKDTQKSHKITATELGVLFRELQRIDRDEFGIETQLGRGMRIYVADSCLKPVYGFAVKATGEVRTCPTDPKKKIGNIKESSLSVILSPHNEIYREGFGKFSCCAVLK